MRSSTSSSDWRVVAFVAALLLAAEFGVRVVEPRLSKDVRHIAAMKDAAKDARIVFLGNSLTRLGVDQEIIETELQGAVRLYPDDTRALEWRYLLDAVVFRDGRAPDVVVLGFARQQLEDTPHPQPRRLAHHFTSWSQTPEVFRHDVRDFDDRVEFCLARVSSAFAAQEHIRRRVLDAVIPGYRAAAAQLNRVTGGKAAAGPRRTRSYSQLRRLANAARARGVSLVLAAMPVADPYELDPALAEFAPLLDMRDTETDDFADALHLGPDGARVYTRLLLERLRANGYLQQR